jgi:hypothetical protein
LKNYIARKERGLEYFEVEEDSPVETLDIHLEEENSKFIPKKMKRKKWRKI